MKNSNIKSVGVSAALVTALVFGSYKEANATKTMIDSESWADESGCIYIHETYQHSFLGINLWTTETTYSVNC